MERIVHPFRNSRFSSIKDHFIFDTQKNNPEYFNANDNANPTIKKFPEKFEFKKFIVIKN